MARTHDGTRGEDARGPGGRGCRRWYLPFLLAAPLVLTMTHRGRAATDPLEECVEVQQAVEKCFGSRHRRPPVYRRPPKDPRAREKMRTQCAESRARIERACR